MALAASYTVSGAGTAAANGTYNPITGANAQLGAQNQFTNGTYFLSYVTTPASPFWAISSAVNPAYNTTTQIYSTGSQALTTGTIPSSGWGVINAGVAAAPTVAAAAAAVTPLANSYILSGAGTAAVNGTYTLLTGANGTFNGANQYSNSAGTYFLAFNSSGPNWAIQNSVNSVAVPVYSGLAGGSPTNLQLTGWTSVNGTAPAPTFAAGQAAATGTNSAPSNLATATPNAAPNAPTLLTATPGNTLVTLNWTNPASLAAIVVQRRIYVAPGGTLNAFVNLVTLPAATAGSPATVPVTYNDTAVTNGTTYEYQVYATP